MRLVVLSLLTVGLLAFRAESASAAPVTIDFGGLIGGGAFTTYVEDGFTVTPISGDLNNADIFGNPVPSVYVGPISSPVESVVEVTGGLFSFLSTDLSCNNGTGCEFEFEGLLGAATVLSSSGTFNGFPGPWETANSTDTVVLMDTLRITLTPSNSGASSINFDNIVLDRQIAVPEPSTFGLLALGVIGYCARRRNIQRSV